MSSDLAFHLLATGVLIVGCTGMGYWLGRWRQLPKKTQASDQPQVVELRWRETERSLVRAIEDCIRSSRELDCHSSQFLAQGEDGAISEQLLDRIDRLIESTSSLTIKVQEVLQADCSATTPISPDRNISSVATDRAAGKLPLQYSASNRSIDGIAPFGCLTQDELESLSNGIDGTPGGTPALDATRHRYECDQWMAAWAVDDPVPTPADFVRVKCHDISCGGIAFVVRDPPDFTTLLITVGTKGRSMIMAAKVAHSHSVFMFGKFGYLVGCEFLKRMSDSRGPLHSSTKSANHRALAHHN